MRGRKIHTGILSHTFSESHSLSLFAFVFLCHSSKHTEAPLGDLKCHLMFASVDFLSGPKLYASKTEQESLSVPTEQHFFPPTYGTYHTLGKMAGSHSLASSEQQPKQRPPAQMSALSDVYAEPQRAACLRSSVSEGLALYGVEQRKWLWLLRGWLEALQPSQSTSTNCTYMAWPKNEITEVFSSEVF